VQFQVHGIENSRHLDTIEWTLLTDQGVQFAYIKASEGSTFRDDYSLGNWAGSRKASVMPGAYHYCSLCAPPLLQGAEFPRLRAALPRIASRGGSGVRGQLPAKAVAVTTSGRLQNLSQYGGTRVKLPHSDLRDR
jgi:lysozyme